MAFHVDSGVAAVGPVVMVRGFINDDDAIGAGVGAVLIDVVNEQQEALCISAADEVTRP